MPTQLDQSSPPLLRLGHGMAFATYLRHVGAPVDRYLRTAGLPVLCDDPDRFVPLIRIWSFFAEAARREDANLGWRVGEHAGDRNLNAALLWKLERAPTLYQSLHRLVRMVRKEASHLRLGIHERQDDILLYTHYPGMGDIPGYASSQAYQLGLFLDLIRHFLGRDWTPEEIGIEHPQAPRVVATYLPGTRILTRQPWGYVAVPRARLHETVPGPGPGRPLDDGPLPSDVLRFEEALRAILPAYLPDGYPSSQFSAALMNVSQRTLARRLTDCGLTYGTLIDEVRFAEAKKLLLEPGMRVDDVALLVGFNDQSNFTRMFRRVGGLTPRAYRRSIGH